MALPQLFVTITWPTGGLPFVDRTFQLAGNISWSVPAGFSLTSKSVSVTYGPGGSTVGATFTAGTNNWQCTGTVNPSTPWSTMVQLSVRARASFRFFHNPFEPDQADISVDTTFMVRLLPAITPTVTLTDFPLPIVAANCP